MNQIRLEEVIESTRSVWWFENHLVWNGGYSSLGWAFIQALVANLFGFNFYNAKFIKLGIEIVGFFCLAMVLKRYLGERIAWLPLLIIGFSPTLLYFNSLQLSVGTEVSFFIICLYILTLVFATPRRWPNGLLRGGLICLFWVLAMLAWLSYFGFIFYLPILLVYYLYLLLKQTRYGSQIRHSGDPSPHPSPLGRGRKKSSLSFWERARVRVSGQNDKMFILKNLTLSFLIFLLPLVAMFFYIKNRELLVFDSASKKGLFRSFAEVSIKPDVFLDTFQRLTKDLFVAPTSYYFESKKVEFSDYYPIVSIITVAGVLFVVFNASALFSINPELVEWVKKKKRLRFLILSLTFFLLGYFILISLIGPKTLGGMRRGTVLLVLFYFLFTISWQFVLSQKTTSISRYALIAGLCLLLIHHLLVYPVNIENIKKPSVFREKWWFNTDTPPNKVLQNLINHITKTNVIVPCWRTENQPKECAGLSLIYPSISLVCKHNHLKCNKLYSYDYDSKKTTLLNMDYWSERGHAEP